MKNDGKQKEEKEKEKEKKKKKEKKKEKKKKKKNSERYRWIASCLPHRIGDVELGRRSHAEDYLQSLLFQCD